MASYWCDIWPLCRWAWYKQIAEIRVFFLLTIFCFNLWEGEHLATEAHWMTSHQSMTIVTYMYGSDQMIMKVSFFLLLTIFCYNTCHGKMSNKRFIALVDFPLKCIEVWSFRGSSTPVHGKNRILWPSKMLLQTNLWFRWDNLDSI